MTLIEKNLLRVHMPDLFLRVRTNLSQMHVSGGVTRDKTSVDAKRERENTTLIVPLGRSHVKIRVLDSALNRPKKEKERSTWPYGVGRRPGKPLKVKLKNSGGNHFK
jgi:hypothetical protein